MKMIIFRENLHTLASLDAKKIFLPNIYLGNKNYARRFDNTKDFICD